MRSSSSSLPSSSSSSSTFVIGGIGVGDGISFFDFLTCFRNSKRACFLILNLQHDSATSKEFVLLLTWSILVIDYPLHDQDKWYNASLLALCIAMLCAVYALDIFSMALAMLFKAFVCSRSRFSLCNLVALEPSGCSNSVLGWCLGSCEICTWLLYNWRSNWFVCTPTRTSYKCHHNIITY